MVMNGTSPNMVTHKCFWKQRSESGSVRVDTWDSPSLSGGPVSGQFTAYFKGSLSTKKQVKCRFYLYNFFSSVSDPEFRLNWQTHSNMQLIIISAFRKRLNDKHCQRRLISDVRVSDDDSIKSEFHFRFIGHSCAVWDILHQEDVVRLWYRQIPILGSIYSGWCIWQDHPSWSRFNVTSPKLGHTE